MALVEKYGGEMPISAQVNKFLLKDKHPRDALKKLMAQPLKAEWVPGIVQTSAASR